MDISNQNLQKNCMEKIYEITEKYFSPKGLELPTEIIEGDENHLPIRLVASMRLNALCREYWRLNTPVIPDKEMREFFHQTDFVDLDHYSVITIEEFLRRVKTYDSIRAACKSMANGSEAMLHYYSHIMKSATDAYRTITQFIKLNDMESIRSERTSDYLREFVMRYSIRDIIQSCSMVLSKARAKIKALPEADAEAKSDYRDVIVSILAYMSKLGISPVRLKMEAFDPATWADPGIEVSSRVAYFTYHDPIANKGVMIKNMMTIEP